MAASGTRHLIEIVSGEASRLREFLAGMDAQTWTTDSTCDGWTIEDVVAHLAGGAVGRANAITRAVAGDAGPPEGQSFLPPGERASHPTGPAARASRQRSGIQLLDDFTAGHDRLRKVLEDLDDGDWDKPCFHRRGALSVKDFLGIQVQEMTLHGWDIRSGLDHAAELWEEPLPLMVGLVPRWLRTAFTPGLDLPTPVRYRFDVLSPVAVHEDLLVNGDSYQGGPSGPEQANAVFRCNTGNYILLMFGRLQVERAVTAGRMAIEGQMDQAKNFNSWFRGF